MTAREFLEEKKDRLDRVCAIKEEYRFLEMLTIALDALDEIQNANGAPDDEDFVTSKAKEAKAKIDGVVNGG